MNTSDEPHLAPLPADEAEERHGHEPSWRALAGAMATAIVWTTRADGRVSAATGWEAATGLPEASVLGRSWLGALHPEDRLRAEAAWAASVRTGEPYEAECRFLRADGEARWHWPWWTFASPTGTAGSTSRPTSPR